ncbi:MAG: lamin tail domain-containing protein [Flavobacteriales bacterium]|nr:lamin tail domain-containing protein [Flavobacteriales bacterium]
MRLFVLMILCSVYSLASAQLTDDFSDGDLTTNPVWNGNTENFIINGNQRLQLNDDEASQSYLSTTFASAELANQEWNIWVKHSFSGSSNNFTRYYLSSQAENLSFTGASSAGAQGYFLLFGESGSEDAIRLLRDDNLGDPVVEIAAGTAGLVAGSFEIRVRVTRDGSGNWQIFVDPDGGTNYQLEASGVDDTYSVATALGLVCNYTVSNADAFQFDDIYFGAQFVDDIAPELQSITTISANEIDVVFNEAVDEASAETVGNYSVSNGVGSPATAERDEVDQSLVHLTFGNTFPENTEVTLTVNGVEDLSGNSLDGGTLNFTWVVSAIAEAGDIVINEILPDPTPALGLPEFEFVEFFNASDNAFDLANFEFVNTNTSKILPSYPLLPGEYVILCDNEAAEVLEAFGPVITVESFTALSNSGDSLTLLSPESTILDIVSYTDDWYGASEFSDGGITLERINPFAGCSGSGNWSASQSFSGGTPGAVNSIFNDAPDATAPTIASFFFPADNSVLIQFDERLADDQLDLISIDIAPAIPILSTTLANDLSAIEIVFDSEFESGTSYTITLSNVVDCSGNASTDDLIIEFTRGSVPQEGDLIMTEIMAAPNAEIPSPNAEYVEVFNRSENLLELTDLLLNDGFFEEQVVLEPGAHLIITDNEDLIDFLLFDNVVGMVEFPGLTNGGRTLTLTDAALNIIDEVSYEDSWYNDPSKDDGGYSLELINPEDPCSDQDNWTASQATTGHTAGAINSVYDETPDQAFPAVLYALVSGANSIDIFFDEQLDLISEETLEVEVGIETNGTFESLGYLQGATSLIPPTRRSMRIEFDGGFSAGVTYICQLTGATDCWGKLTEGVELVRFAVPEDAEAGDLIINEILFDPYTDGTDFVEIYNRSEKNISILNWQLGNEANGIPENFKPISEVPFIIYPGEYFVFTESVSGVTAFYPNAAETAIIEVADLPTYSNNSGVVVLTDSLFTISDRVPYDDSQHYPLLDDTEGVSLERLSAERYSDDETNWHSAASIEGFATPGYMNSQFDQAMSESVVSASPEVFSPDNDGFEDNLLISYNLGRAGFTGNIQIFDDGGRFIRRLANNETLGMEGTLSWNGITDHGEKAPIGIYVIIFEVFHPDGEVIFEKLVCTLGHQLD